MKKLLLVSILLLLPNLSFAATTWNPSDKSTNITLSNGNLTATVGTAAWSGVRGTNCPSTGKYYWEITMNAGSATDGGVGLMTAATTLNGSNYANPSGSYFFYPPGGGFYNNGSLVFATSNITVGDVVSLAYDAGTGRIWGADNGVWYNSGNPGAGTGYIWTGLAASLCPMYGSTVANGTVTVNFGATTFKYTKPTGFSGFDSPPVASTPAGLILSFFSSWF